MARCYTFTPDQVRERELDAWGSANVERDVQDWTDRYDIREPVIVVTPEHRIVFALDHTGQRIL